MESWKQPKRIEKLYQRQLFAYLNNPDPDFAERIARQMITAVRVNSAQGWKKAAAESTRSRLIHRLLRDELRGPVGLEVERLIRRNAFLIRTLPDSIADKTSAWVSEQQRRGRRSEAIQQELEERLPQLTSSQVRLIARTETAKSETAITRSRAESIGLRWYEWRSSEDGRVRKSHRKMDGVLCRFSDPPNPEALIGEKSDGGNYAPGEIWNCRCLALPLVDLDEVSWPHRVYHNGAITRMTRKQFEGIA